MKRNLLPQERPCRRWFESIFRACKKPIGDLSEIKAYLDRSSWANRIKNEPWMDKDEKEQEAEVGKYVSAEYVLAKMNRILKHTSGPLITNEEVLQIFFRCPSTYVEVVEIVHNMKHAKVGARAPGTVKDPVPRRNEYPRIIDTKLFVERIPIQISWPQLRKFIGDFFRFMEIIGQIDDEFYILQYYKTQEFVPENHTSKHRLRREIQDYHHVVNFVTFFEALADQVFPLTVAEVLPTHKHQKKSTWNIDQDKSHHFWSTRTGQIWFAKYQHEVDVNREKPIGITWNEVYMGKNGWGDNGLCAIMPNISRYSLIQIMNSYPRDFKAADNTNRMRTKFKFLAGSGVMEIMDEDQTQPIPFNSETPLPLDEAQITDSYVEAQDENDDNVEDNDDDDSIVENGDTNNNNKKGQSRGWFSMFKLRYSNKNNNVVNNDNDTTSSTLYDSNAEDPVDVHQQKVGKIERRPVFRKVYRE